MNEAEYLMKNYGDRGGCWITPSEKNSSKFGHQYLVMVNYMCAFSQSESGKYFE